MTTLSEPAVKIDADVTLEIRIEAKPETIFPYLIDSELVSKWMGTEAEMDPRPGGIYRSKLNETVIGSGEFIEVDAPRRIVFSFGWEGEGQHVPAGSTTVAIDLFPDGDETVVRLVHSNLPSEETKPDHAGGWGQYLSRLKVVSEGGDAGADPHLN